MADENEKDLEELDKRSRRKIELPDEKKIIDGEICWNNSQRICGADCIAFNTDSLDDNGDPVQGPTKCIFIVLLGQLGANSGSLVQLLTKGQLMSRTPGAPPPPKVG